MLRERGAIEDLFGPTLAQPVSHAHDNDPMARGATYFVIPRHLVAELPHQAVADDRSTSDPKINNLARYACSNNIERAHVFINRGGEIFLAHDFAVPWRATKFETAKNFGTGPEGACSCTSN